MALKIKERVSDNEVEYLDSDFYFVEMLKVMVDYGKKNHCFPAIRGLSPQTNKDFAAYFRKIIEEKTNNLIISMALIEVQCKEEILKIYCILFLQQARIPLGIVLNLMIINEIKKQH